MTQQIPPLVYDQKIKNPGPSPSAEFPIFTSRKIRLSSCCGCLSVRTGVIIIGILSTISSLMTIIIWAIKPVGFVGLFVTPVAHFLFGILLIVGAYNRKSKFVLPMLCILFVDLVITIPTFSVLSVEIAVYLRHSGGYYAGIFIVIGLAFGLATFFFIVIKSFYEELESEKRLVVKMDGNIAVECTEVNVP